MARWFNLWNLFQYDDYYEFDLTQADASGIRAGTRELIAHCMDVAGLAVPLRSWEITASRSSYYSDYTTAPNWRDRWSRCWTVRVYPEGQMVPLANQLSSTPLYIVEADATWDAADPDPRIDRTALVIVDYQTDAPSVEQQLQAVLTEASLSYSDSRMEIRQYGERLHQLRLRFGGDLFPDQASQLDALIERLTATGGATNWRDRLPWLEKKPEITPDMQAWMDQMLGRSKSE